MSQVPVSLPVLAFTGVCVFYTSYSFGTMVLRKLFSPGPSRIPEYVSIVERTRMELKEEKKAEEKKKAEEAKSRRLSA